MDLFHVIFFLGSHTKKKKKKKKNPLSFALETLIKYHHIMFPLRIMANTAKIIFSADNR